MQVLNRKSKGYEGDILLMKWGSPQTIMRAKPRMSSSEACAHRLGGVTVDPHECAENPKAEVNEHLNLHNIITFF